MTAEDVEIMGLALMTLGALLIGGAMLLDLRGRGYAEPDSQPVEIPVRDDPMRDLGDEGETELPIG